MLDRYLQAEDGRDYLNAERRAVRSSSSMSLLLEAAHPPETLSTHQKALTELSMLEVADGRGHLKAERRAVRSSSSVSLLLEAAAWPWRCAKRPLGAVAMLAVRSTPISSSTCTVADTAIVSGSPQYP